MISHVDRSVTVIDIKGRLVLGEGSGALRDKINSLLARASNRILLNLNDVTYMDSSAIGELVAAHRNVIEAGGTIKLLHLPKRIHDLLLINKLHMVFEIFEDESTAVRSFTPAVPSELESRYQAMFKKFKVRGQNPALAQEDLPPSN